MTYAELSKIINKNMSKQQREREVTIWDADKDVVYDVLGIDKYETDSGVDYSLTIYSRLGY